MNDFMATLKSKAGPLPIWAWALLGTIALALFLMHKKAKGDTSQAAADQTNSDLGSAAELANMFEVAGLMPYQGGDVYINTTETNNPPSSPSKPTPLPWPWPPGHDHPKPPTGGGTKPPTTSGKGKYVTVSKFTSKNAPWNSTVWGITTHLLGPKAKWQSVWNAPENAALRAKRKSPKNIQPGDKVFVPGAK